MNDVFVLPDTLAGEDIAIDVAVSHMAAGFSVALTRENYGGRKLPAPVIVVTCVNNKPSRKERGCFI